MTTTRHSLYDGQVILETDFTGRKHDYYANGKKVPNATGIARVLDKPQLRKWDKDQLLDGLSAYLKGRMGDQVDELLIRDTREAIKDAPFNSMRRSGDIGKDVHAWIEAYVQAEVAGNQLPFFPVADALAEPCRRFDEWAVSNDVEFHFAERKVYSRQYCYAGTLDIGATVNGHFTILDAKTGNSVAGRDGVYPEIRMQLAAYWQALEEEEGIASAVGPIDADPEPHRTILHIPTRTGEFAEYQLPPETYQADLEAFLYCRGLWGYLNKEAA